MMPVLQKGQRLGPDTEPQRYQILKHIGYGQFADVYEVRDGHSKESKLAIKIEKRPEVRSVKQEYKIMRHLHSSCPQIAQVYSGGVLAGGADRYYMTMELLGTNLADYRRQCPGGRMDACAVRIIGSAMLDALHAMHAAGFIHRDVKPANFSQSAGAPGVAEWKLLDLGLARRYKDDTGAVLPARPDAAFRGSTTYASPNVHAGLDQSRRDDMWSWFYCVVEMAEGKLPWKQEAAEAAAMAAAAREAAAAEDHRAAVAAVKAACVQEPSKLAKTQGMAGVVTTISKHLASLEFDGEPDYGLIRTCLASIPDAWQTTSPGPPLHNRQNDHVSAGAPESMHTSPGRSNRKKNNPRRPSVAADMCDEASAGSPRSMRSQHECLSEHEPMAASAPPDHASTADVTKPPHAVLYPPPPTPFTPDMNLGTTPPPLFRDGQAGISMVRQDIQPQHTQHPANPTLGPLQPHHAPLQQQQANDHITDYINWLRAGVSGPQAELLACTLASHGAVDAAAIMSAVVGASVTTTPGHACGALSALLRDLAAFVQLQADKAQAKYDANYGIKHVALQPAMITQAQPQEALQPVVVHHDTAPAGTSPVAAQQVVAQTTDSHHIRSPTVQDAVQRKGSEQRRHPSRFFGHRQKPLQQQEPSTHTAATDAAGETLPPQHAPINGQPDVGAVKVESLGMAVEAKSCKGSGDQGSVPSPLPSKLEQSAVVLNRKGTTGNHGDTKYDSKKTVPKGDVTMTVVTASKSSEDKAAAGPSSTAAQKERKDLSNAQVSQQLKAKSASAASKDNRPKADKGIKTTPVQHQEDSARERRVANLERDAVTPANKKESASQHVDRTQKAGDKKRTGNDGAVVQNGAVKVPKRCRSERSASPPGRNDRREQRSSGGVKAQEPEEPRRPDKKFRFGHQASLKGRHDNASKT